MIPIPAEVVSDIRLLILDVDGVLTDGGIVYGANGEEFKRFNAQDGAGIKYWHRAGNISAIITGRDSPIVARRAEELGISEVVSGAKNKLPAFESLIAKLNITPQQCVYIGDDLPDVPVMRNVALSIGVSNAVPDVKSVAFRVTNAGGGYGAVREAIECILKAQGKWDAILSRYFQD